MTHKWLSRAVEFEVLEQLLETFLAVVVLDVDIDTADLLFTSHSLNPEEQFTFFL